ncbi:MAG: hypothetical protein AUK47_12555 [Deltaproteobacteria bacterium CG2_30_63_29]|nr:MAG: hypothetical protein AUK47_12555 [Deltaproteobacteria bacterium CG2_30_63_29]PIW01593.1 MAG: hypothetical protein COW42_04420 [Deltaproteobacteria bacterium CG17_big_fil_post_rev_8_21_14_2_50_63_7]PJB35325.1 MAG: hypothetical protein CO108_26045 [Deltaproteobacteria bacterium CG_4_9_14_3_um_filter_63_12]
MSTSNAQKLPDPDALIETMLLMVAANGTVNDGEMNELSKVVSEHPIFKGFDTEAVAQSFSKAFEALAVEGFEKRMEAIADALGTHHAQLLAFALACQVCFADGRIDETEFALLRTFQIVFGLSDETVSFVITHIQDRDSIDHIVDRLWKLYTETEQPDIQSVYIEVMLLMATEGGVVQEDEITQLAMTVASHADFSGMNTSQVSEAIQTALARIQADGTATRLSALSRQLVDISERTKAMGFAYSILVADGVVAPGESRCLKQMQAAFRLSEEAMKRIVSTIPAE